ncbi:hypothetical protein OH76DRAFT_1402073 [Lentinus brumalis]|uniref:Uncharacterized protein n=1 Tax=Lentinus brumalis TaxID=2498619 RepID=A0A371DE65_9APHY|nr:hypothetical protein OH76DRAFT_1402073 [Polyporus brumalis]
MLNRRAVVVLSLAAFASAQYYDPYYDGNRNTPGRVIAGIVVAISIAILFLICFALMFRRRRRGLTVLPSYAGGNLIGSNNHNPPVNQNQGPYASYPMSNQQAWGGYQAPPGPPPQGDFVPPPPYPGKPVPYDGEANSGYGHPTVPGQEAPKPGGFVVPQESQTPNSPAPAHTNTSSPWFRRS